MKKNEIHSFMKIGNFIMVFFIFVAVLLFESCESMYYAENPEKHAKTTVFWDENLPKEHCLGLFIHEGLTVTSYNGVPVNWGKNTMAYLPPGTVNLLMDAHYMTGVYDSNGNMIIYNGKNWPFQWTFNAGDVYLLRGWADDIDTPVIKVVNSKEKIDWRDQASYRVPLQKGPIILQ